MDDLISRQAAIDALMEILDRPNHAEFLYTDEICKALKALPSAQPEIVRCKDCKCWTEWANGTGSCNRFTLDWIGTDADDFCSMGEKRR